MCTITSMHFYHLHALDWVDVVSALKADPAATSRLWRNPSLPIRNPVAGYFQRIAEEAQKLRRRGQLGIFANGFWGNPAYKLPPEANLMAVAHYLEALAWQREVVQDPHDLRRQESRIRIFLSAAYHLRSASI